MKIKNTTYNLFDRRLTVMLVVLGLIITSFFASAGEPKAVHHRTLPDTAQFLPGIAREADAVVNEGRTSRNIHLPVRGKVKIKGFYKQYFLSSTAFSILHFRNYTVPLVTSFTSTVSKPGYYNFLFRLTPF